MKENSYKEMEDGKDLNTEIIMWNACVFKSSVNLFHKEIQALR